MSTRNGRRVLTAEQEAKRDARRERFSQLAKQIGGMTEEQRATMAARMAGVATIEGRVLSVHNACLLWCQYPTATMVGGFQQWRTAGRQVRKGEHGLMIWAPIRRNESEAKIELDGTAPATAEVSGGRSSFIMVTVFDVSQTDEVGQ